MTSGAWKGIGIACLVMCAILLFVAFERYQTNAQNVDAMNQSPMGRMVTGEAKLEPATPAATKYALLFAVVAGIGGAVCLVKGAQDDSKEAPAPEPVSEAPEAPSVSDAPEAEGSGASS